MRRAQLPVVAVGEGAPEGARGGPTHPTCQAIEELGRAVRAAFICGCLADVELDMNSRLDLGPTPVVPRPRTAQEEPLAVG